MAETGSPSLSLKSVSRSITTRYTTRDFYDVEKLIMLGKKTGMIRVHYNSGGKCLIDFVETESTTMENSS